eukprot:SAG11_NODE_838_length_6918_cov_3.566945_4_plen_66_part_00
MALFYSEKGRNPIMSIDSLTPQLEMSQFRPHCALGQHKWIYNHNTSYKIASYLLSSHSYYGIPNY